MRDASAVRTTLDLDEDLLQTAKELASARGRTAGQIVSELMRKALEAPAAGTVRNGVPLLPPRPSGSRRPTMASVNQLRDD
jgi:hypothetical protein